MTGRLVLAAACALAGCAPGQSSVEVEPLDRATYDQVHPILEARCATLDCHGDPGRPLRLHAETGLRAAGIARTEPLADLERDENLRSIAAVDPDAPSVDDSLVLTKPLVGGEHHVGGDLFHARDEAQFLCLRGWLAGESASTGVATACAEAAREVELPPPDP